MGMCGNCCFKTAYMLYARTCIGRCVHNKCLKHFKKHYGENAVHSRITPFLFTELLILPHPFLVNNYTYVIADIKNNNFVLVDVGDASRMRGLSPKPDAVLTTHKHWDHSGGNREMRSMYPGLRVYGGVADNVPDCTHRVKDGDELTFGRLKFTAIWTPGHTRGHIVWHLHGEPFGAPDSLFTGDNLMLAGCGAPFEGPVTQMIESLEKMTRLPPNTLVWPGHEMAVDGLELAVFIEDQNLAAMFKLMWAISQREKMLCCCPSTIFEEMSYNPFLRTKNEEMRKALGVYEYIKTDTKTQKDEDRIGAICFDLIVQKSEDLHRLKRILKKKHMEAIKEKAKSPKEDDTTKGEKDEVANSPVDVPTPEVERAATLKLTTASDLDAEKTAKRQLVRRLLMLACLTEEERQSMLETQLSLGGHSEVGESSVDDITAIGSQMDYPQSSIITHIPESLVFFEARIMGKEDDEKLEEETQIDEEDSK